MGPLLLLRLLGFFEYTKKLLNVPIHRDIYLQRSLQSECDEIGEDFGYDDYET